MATIKIKVCKQCKNYEKRMKKAVYHEDTDRYNFVYRHVCWKGRKRTGAFPEDPKTLWEKGRIPEKCPYGLEHTVLGQDEDA